MPFELTENVHIDRDEQGQVQHLEHFQQPFVAADAEGLAALTADATASVVSAATPQALAEQYLQQVAPVYGINENMLSGHGEAALTAEGAGAGSKLELTEEKEMMGTTIISYQQTYDGLPVWEAGVSVTIQPEPMRVTASQSSVHQEVSLPQADTLNDGGAYGPDAITQNVLKQVLGVAKKPVINGKSRLVYRYEPKKRIDPEAQSSPGGELQEGPPTLPLPPVSNAINPGQHYVVTEALFTLPVEGFGSVNWRAFIEVNAGEVLYLRAFVACASAMVYRTDPLTAGAGAGVTPTAADATLNPFRSTVILSGLTNGSPQGLLGQFVRLIDSDAPVAPPPTQANPPANFFYNARAREFAAVNAYHHCDWLFRLMQGMGFNIANYFNGTAFPVPVDACAFSDQINARAPGNAGGTGSGGFQFGLAGSPFPAVSIAADVRVVLHEFGHTLLWDSVHSPNFGFAHSAGDSLAAILMDPESALRNDAIRRFQTFPWVLPGSRNHGRDVATGWGWGGSSDVGGYNSEQILSTTHFRLYRSLGGDSNDVNRRKLAARQVVYLIFRAIGSLATNPVTPTPRPDIFATALMNADIGTSNFEGQRGGAFHKVIRWSFEKQGLYQPAGAPRPVTRPGAAPDVDVYINDGRDYLGNPRNGEYIFQPFHWECTEIWNRLAPSAGGGGGVHQTPVVGRTNHAYVRVKNRGTQPAAGVLVRGYSANPGAGLTWPGDWRPMDTPRINVAGAIAPGAAVVVGPFKWTPRVVGHECMFMEVSANGDFSNIDPRTFFPCAAGPIPEWRLVPFDNNIAQRNVTPVPGAGGVRGLLSAFLNRQFLVRNPFEQQARIEVKAELSPFLKERGWGALLDQRDTVSAFGLAPGNAREVTIKLRPGQEFTREQLLQAGGGVFIRAIAYADGLVIGGMTYQLDPTLREAPVERVGDNPIRLNDPAIRAAIRDAELLTEETGTAFATAEADIVAALEETDAADGGATVAEHLLSQLSAIEETIGKVNRVKLRKVTVEIEVGDS